MQRTPAGTDRYDATALRAAIDEQGIRYIWVAEQLGWSKQRLNRVMDQQITVSADEAKEVAKLLRVPFDLLFELHDRSKTLTSPEGVTAA